MPKLQLSNKFEYLKKILSVAHLRSRLLWPIRLPQGIWWLYWNDAVSYRILNRSFEEDELNFMMQYLSSGMTVLDIGAHHGLFTTLAAKKVGAQGKVVAFEPSKRERRRLILTLALNRIRNVQLISCALGSIGGTTTLYVCKQKKTGCNSLRPPVVDEPVTPVQVPITTLDRFLASQPASFQVDFLKLDVEGAELDVFRGSLGLLKRLPRPVIMCELVDLRCEPWGYTSYEIYDFVAKYDFVWFSIAKNGTLVHCLRKKNFHENLVAVPKEKLDAMASFIRKSSPRV